MNVVVFGATGATGLLLVEQALQRGHTVTAFVRDAARLRRTHAALRTVVGDVMEPSTLNSGIQGQDVVLCALGTMPQSRSDRARRQRRAPVCSIGTANIVQVMLSQGVRRIVVESSVSVGESRRTGRFGAGMLIRLLMAPVMDDKERQEEVVRQCGLDWTILRPVRLSNGVRTGCVKLGEEIEWGLGSSVSRADVASVMLDAIADPRTIGRAMTLRS